MKISFSILVQIIFSVYCLSQKIDHVAIFKNKIIGEWEATYTKYNNRDTAYVQRQYRQVFEFFKLDSFVERNVSPADISFGFKVSDSLTLLKGKWKIYKVRKNILLKVDNRHYLPGSKGYGGNPPNAIILTIEKLEDDELVVSGLEGKKKIQKHYRRINKNNTLK